MRLNLNPAALFRLSSWSELVDNRKLPVALRMKYTSVFLRLCSCCLLFLKRTTSCCSWRERLPAGQKFVLSSFGSRQRQQELKLYWAQFNLQRLHLLKCTVIQFEVLYCSIYNTFVNQNFDFSSFPLTISAALTFICWPFGGAPPLGWEPLD